MPSTSSQYWSSFYLSYFPPEREKVREVTEWKLLIGRTFVGEASSQAISHFSFQSTQKRVGEEKHPSFLLSILFAVVFARVHCRVYLSMCLSLYWVSSSLVVSANHFSSIGSKQAMDGSGKKCSERNEDTFPGKVSNLCFRKGKNGRRQGWKVREWRGTERNKIKWEKRELRRKERAARYTRDFFKVHFSPSAWIGRWKAHG